MVISSGTFRHVKDALKSRLFTEEQVEKILNTLPKRILTEPDSLTQTIDTWNKIMSMPPSQMCLSELHLNSIPATAQPPKKSHLAAQGINMNTVLADIEPSLLMFLPDKLLSRHKNIIGLGLLNSHLDMWSILFNAPRGFFLQDWAELTKKIYYVQHHLIDFLHDKREQRSMIIHPIVRSASITEVDFDHIRTRYLFALRCGYQALAFMYPITSAANKPELHDLILSDHQSYLKTFAPFCSKKEYDAFSYLIKSHDLDDDDAEIFTKLADLEATSHVKR